jgi:hypothetical protein
LLIKDIREDFYSNIQQYLRFIDQIKEINRDHPITLGIWGVPPSWKEGAIIFEYLRSEGTKVVGTQHGGLYGDSLMPWHFDSDFNRCDYFISYGFTKNDISRLYPTRKLDCEILSFGKAKTIRTRKSHKKIDILFPITMSKSMFNGGMTRIPPDKLVERQKAILEYLNSLANYSVYVKPIAYSNCEKCATMPMYKRLKNLKIINNLTLEKFLEGHSPKVVLMEYPAQPLYDIIHLDTEIFLMGDWLHPFESKALESLQKRVHYSEDTDEVISKIELFLKGGLEKKRDDTFYKYYMKKENTEENITRFVDKLIES